jgi:UDP-N-acetylglucosamine--N-acetylmuramyl-(pentapeptide) pyrophosphoryl-undecaprenol N-acetylglucosamine transferase
MEYSAKKIILTGGGTAGSVSPLLAIAEDLRKSGEFEFLFLGTKNGPEAAMVAEAGIKFKIIIAGKLRRYFDWHNFFDVIKIKLAFWQAFFILLKFKPDLVMSAGSFAAVPVVWAAWVLRIPVIVHQMDVRPGLANKIMSPFAKIITVTFEKSLADYGVKAIFTGNPVRASFPVPSTRDKLRRESSLTEKFNLKSDKPVVFITGGGTGAEGINILVEQGLDNLLSFCQVIHLTGKGKMTAKRHENYHPFEFFNAEEMAAAWNIADVVVSRAGLGAITEISAAGKPAIIIPMPDSHQEDNAALLLEKNAALVLNQKLLNADSFVAAIKSLLDNPDRREELGGNIKGLFKEGANEDIVGLVVKLLHC